MPKHNKQVAALIIPQVGWLQGVGLFIEPGRIDKLVGSEGVVPALLLDPGRFSRFLLVDKGVQPVCFSVVSVCGGAQSFDFEPGPERNLSGQGGGTSFALGQSRPQGLALTLQSIEPLDLP